MATLGNLVQLTQDLGPQPIVTKTAEACEDIFKRNRGKDLATDLVGEDAKLLVSAISEDLIALQHSQQTGNRTVKGLVPLLADLDQSALDEVTEEQIEIIERQSKEEPVTKRRPTRAAPAPPAGAAPKPPAGAAPEAPAREAPKPPTIEEARGRTLGRSGRSLRGGLSSSVKATAATKAARPQTASEGASAADPAREAALEANRKALLKYGMDLNRVFKELGKLPSAKEARAELDGIEHKLGRRHGKRDQLLQRRTKYQKLSEGDQEKIKDCIKQLVHDLHTLRDENPNEDINARALEITQDSGIYKYVDAAKDLGLNLPGFPRPQEVPAATAAAAEDTAASKSSGTGKRVHFDDGTEADTDAAEEKDAGAGAPRPGAGPGGGDG